MILLKDKTFYQKKLKPLNLSLFLKLDVYEIFMQILNFQSGQAGIEISR